MSSISDATRIAREFHRHYERLASRFGWETQMASQQPWDELPGAHRDLMVAVVETLLDRCIIAPGAALNEPDDADVTGRKPEEGHES